jgi:acetyltransferase-like isoleucine patch superfamily enzyme
MKTILKSVADGVALLLVLPAALLYWLGRAVLGPDRAFPGWSQALALLPGLTGVYLRRAFYRLALSRCASGCCLSFGTIISHPTAEIGRDVYVGPYGCLGAVSLEDDVLLGSHVSIMNGGGQHGIDRLDVPIREQPGCYPRVTIGRDSWIGERSIVLADIGHHCVIGAGSVVTRPVPDFAIAVGNPARVIRLRNQDADSNRAVAMDSVSTPRPRATCNPTPEDLA